MDFTPTNVSPTSFSDAFQALLDEAHQIHNMEQEPRDYLGGSRLGVECDRALAYEYFQVAKDPDRNFKGKILRIFDMGHDGEDRMAEYIRRAGFTLLTHRSDGQQFGFGVAPDPVTGKSRIAGHIDGILTDGPEYVGCTKMTYPCLWENKGLNDKGSKGCVKKGVKEEKPIYYAQMQIYMAYLGLGDNPGLFTALNRNTGDIHSELVPFDAQAAQQASDRGVRVIRADSPEDLPRIARESTDFRCKFCDYAARCWGAAEPQAAAPVPAPLFGAQPAAPVTAPAAPGTNWLKNANS